MERTAAREDAPLVCALLAGIHSGAAALYARAGTRAFLFGQSGVLAVAQSDAGVSALVSFAREADDAPTLTAVSRLVEEARAQSGGRPFFLNIRGDNTRLIARLTASGYRRDAYGYEYILPAQAYKAHTAPAPKDVAFAAFGRAHIPACLRLIDAAFNPQRALCGEETDACTKHAGEESPFLLDAAARGDLFMLRRGADIAGLAVISGDCLVTLAVRPDLKGRGYGALLVDRCLAHILITRKNPCARLYVYHCNARAQALYARMGFEKRGFYCENTYIGEETP